MTTAFRQDPRLFERMTRLSREVILPAADSADREARFPLEAIRALQDERLMGWFVPRSHGGMEANLEDFCGMCALIAEGCTSTGLIWAMHSQQVAVLARHAVHSHAKELERAAKGALVASVTSEHGKGGELLAAETPLLSTSAGFELQRSAPSVSYGEHAEIFLVTMRRSQTAARSEVALVVVDRSTTKLKIKGPWLAMGMRGTQTVPMTLSARVDTDRVLGANFRQIALETMVPVGHLGWASVWLGAARGGLNRLLRSIRGSSTRRLNLKSDLLLARIAQQRLRLDLIEALTMRVASDISALWVRSAPAAAYEAVDLSIRLNNVKVASAQLAFAIVSDLVEIAGLADGYLCGNVTGLERIFRDLRSATLMFHDDRLLAVNGRLTVLESAKTGNSRNVSPWAPGEEMRNDS